MGGPPTVVGSSHLHMHIWVGIVGLDSTVWISFMLLVFCPLGCHALPELRERERVLYTLHGM